MFTNIRDRIRRRWRRSQTLAEFLGPVRRYLPTARIRDAVITRRGFKWGVPAMLLAVPYLVAIAFITDFIEQADPIWGWLHLINLLCVWNAIKMLWLGPISLIRLAHVRYQEHQARKQEEAQATDAKHDAGEPVLVGGVS